MKKTFLSLYNATSESLKGDKLKLVQRKNERAVESAIDSAESKKINAEEALDSELNVVVKGGTINVNRILELRQEISNAEATIEALKEFKEEFFAKEAEEVKA